MNLKNLFLLSITIYLFTGCSYKNDSVSVDMSDNNKYSTFRSASLENTINRNDLKNKKYTNNQIKNKTFENYDNTNYSSSKDTLNNELYNFYVEWEGVKYKFGGESKNGIDCSSFIQKAFKEKLDLSMPRTTSLQSEVGKEINKDELTTGDLVFFHTGRTKHVGIYMENGKFIHASTKYGVTISDLDNSYFAKNYWKAQRIID